MDITFSYKEEFSNLIDSIRNVYGEKIMELEGIGLSQLDINQNAKQFLLNTTTTADVSVDANANVDTKDIVGYQFEVVKPIFRLNSAYLLWEKLYKSHGKDYANEVITRQIIGDIYINDFGDVGKSYCFNYSMYDVCLFGLPMIKKIKSVPPKTLFAYKSQVEQFIIHASNSTLGATGLADYLICMAWYVDKIEKNNYCDGKIKLYPSSEAVDIYIKENLISFIYTINQPLRSSQSPFTNISIYDDYFLDELIKGYIFFDGTTPKKETVKRIQELYIDAMNEEMHRTPITFPVEKIAA